MNAKKVFCTECRNDVDYTITSVPMTGTIKEKNILILEKKHIARTVVPFSLFQRFLIPISCLFTMFTGNKTELFPSQ